MPIGRYPWTVVDYAAALNVAEMMSAKQLTLYDIVKMSDGQLRYSRIRDIKNADKAPVRISEFVLICEIADYSPIKMFAKVCQDARSIRCGYLAPVWPRPDGELLKPTQEELTRPPYAQGPTHCATHFCSRKPRAETSDHGKEISSELLVV